MGSGLIPPFTQEDLACEKSSLEVSVVFSRIFMCLVYLFPNCRSHFYVFVAKFSTEALLKPRTVFEADIEHVLFPDNHT